MNSHWFYNQTNFYTFHNKVIPCLLFIQSPFCFCKTYDQIVNCVFLTWWKKGADTNNNDICPPPSYLFCPWSRTLKRGAIKVCAPCGTILPLLRIKIYGNIYIKIYFLHFFFFYQITIFFSRLKVLLASNKIRIFC